MRHRLSGKKLNRDSGHRRALFKNLARGFFANNGRLETTLPKAKAVQRLIERMIARAGNADLISRRWLFSYFQDQHFVNSIIDRFGKQFSKRHGGYTRILKLKRRKGDNAIVVRLGLVEKLKAEEREKEEEKEREKEKKKLKFGRKKKDENLSTKSK